MQHAIDLKKQKRLLTVFSLRGVVHVRVRPQSDAVRVHSVDDVNKIAALNNNNSYNKNGKCNEISL